MDSALEFPPNLAFFVCVFNLFLIDGLFLEGVCVCEGVTGDAVLLLK